MTKDKFTLEEIRNYVLSQKSLSEVLENLNTINICNSNIKEIVFKKNIIDDDFEITEGVSISDCLEDYLRDNIRDLFDFNEWDECEGSNIIYFEYSGKKYELTFKYGYCVESTHEHRIMQIIPLVKEL